jgi:antitoxin (DNA-binding transcriptional repressor) of toxin-antitoxin stability system
MNRRRANNTIEVNGLVLCIGVSLMLGLAGLFYVYLKNQQHAVGNQSRVVEASLREEEARNEALRAKITALTSRASLMHRVEEGYIHLLPVRDTAIARITPAAPAEMDGVLRTASRDPAVRVGPGGSQRSVSR